MLGNLKTLNHRLLMRRCLDCGYDGPQLHGGQTDQCPRCGCDLRKRPARSYAEMEGLVGQTIPLDNAIADSIDTRNDSLVQRWLAFLFMAMMGMVAFAYLSAEALGAY
jgi:hypothetical protein